MSRTMSKTVIADDAVAVGARPRTYILGLVGAAVTMVVVPLLPTPQGLPLEGQRMAALFAGVLVLWSTEALPIAVTAVLALVLQPVFRLGTLGAAFTSFMSPVFFFVMVMFAIAFAWVKTGLARRFAFWLIAQAGTDARRTVYVFVIGTGLVSTMI